MKRVRFLTLAFGLIALAAGCTVLNKPDRDAIVGDASMDSLPPDTGDAAVDGDAGDGGDGGDACARNEICTGREDEDCDTLIDCADPDCASRMECCDGGTTGAVLWSDSELTDFWKALPDGNLNDPDYDAVAGVLNGFDNVEGIITQGCVPLATGYRIVTYFRMDSTTCTGAAECYVSFVLTPAPTTSAGRRLPDDLAVNAYSDGRLTVTNGGRVLGESTLVLGVAQYFTIDITVGNDGGIASLLARVQLRGQAAALVEDEPIAPLASLLRDGECVTAGGLNLAVEGAGRQFAVGPLDKGGLECINASNFAEPPMTSSGILSATPTSLAWGDWASGGIGSPSIAVAPTGSTTTMYRWHVIGDGTDFDRAVDGAAIELGFSMGFSRTTNPSWNSEWTAVQSVSPMIGSCYPSCAGDPPGGSCMDTCSSGLTDNGSIRDPSFEQISVETATSPVATIAYATRTGPDAYGIAFESSFTTDSASEIFPNAAALSPGSVQIGGSCMSLRDPMLVRRDRDDPMAGYWLFFSCYEALDVAEIHAIRIDAALRPVMDTHVRVVERADLGDWAASSVWSPEVIVEHEPGTDVDGRHLFRMWFLARNRTSDRVSIGLVQGQLDEARIAAGLLPDFEAFGANPVLSEGDLALGCGPFCRLRGLAVVRVPATQTLRFLIAREDGTNPTAVWHYAPFEQYWKSPWE